MSGRLFEAESVTVAIVVCDRGAEHGAERFEASLEDYALVRGSGRSAWEAVNRLVGAHRALLERRWSA